MHTNNKNGFTLVELSIVLVIIGLLVAAIVAGDSMIEQAELRSAISDLQSYQSAYNGFKSAYNGVPGDLTTASAYWSSTQCATSDPTVCNGNGDGIITVSNRAGPAADEVRPALRELSLAKFISSAVEAVPDDAGAVYTTQLTPGINAGVSRIPNGGYFLAGGANKGTNIVPSILQLIQDADLGSTFPPSINAVYLGSPWQVDNLIGSVLSPEDAFNIDQKIDDGAVVNGAFTGAFTGKFMGVDGSAFFEGCASFPNGMYSIPSGPPAAPECYVGLALN